MKNVPVVKETTVKGEPMSQELINTNPESNDLDIANNPFDHAKAAWQAAGSPSFFYNVFEHQKKMYLAVMKKEGLTLEILADAAIRIQFVQLSESGDHSFTLEVMSEHKTWYVHQGKGPFGASMQ